MSNISTNWSAINNVNDLLTSANTHAPFWAGVLLMMWIVLVITFLPYGVHIAIIGGSFLAFIIGLFLAYMGLVAWKWVFGMAGLAILIVIIDALTAKKE